MDHTIHMPNGFKHLTLENWTEPDETGRAFAEINLATGECQEASPQHWAEQFLAVELSSRVPEDIREMWAVARGVLLYGWFFYPLYALGGEQLHRVAEAAVLMRYEQAGGPRRLRGRRADLKGRLEWLISQRIISTRAEQRWDAIRKLRNYGSHPTFAALAMPTEALESLELLAAEIEVLYAEIR